MAKSDEIKEKNEKKERITKNKSISEEQKQKVKELEYLLQCASAECGW